LLLLLFLLLIFLLILILLLPLLFRGVPDWGKEREEGEPD
jgi:hypothetical protein